MHKTTGENNADGKYTEGPPATTVNADSMNTLQNELVNTIEGAGLTLADPENDDCTQLLGAINKRIADTEIDAGTVDGLHAVDEEIELNAADDSNPNALTTKSRVRNLVQSTSGVKTIGGEQLDIKTFQVSIPVDASELIFTHNIPGDIYTNSKVVMVSCVGKQQAISQYRFLPTQVAEGAFYEIQVNDTEIHLLRGSYHATTVEYNVVIIYMV
ncbi:MAG: hypothetical protein GY757_09225 [bacterium]|nr:hypothetical protein [bacterium]